MRASAPPGGRLPTPPALHASHEVGSPHGGSPHHPPPPPPPPPRHRPSCARRGAGAGPLIARAKTTIMIGIARMHHEVGGVWGRGGALGAHPDVEGRPQHRHAAHPPQDKTPASGRRHTAPPCVSVAHAPRVSRLAVLCRAMQLTSSQARARAAGAQHTPAHGAGCARRCTWSVGGRLPAAHTIAGGARRRAPCCV